jgi:hypothetical protein
LNNQDYLYTLADRCLSYFKRDPLSPNAAQFAMWARELVEHARELRPFGFSCAAEVDTEQAVAAPRLD